MRMLKTMTTRTKTTIYHVEGDGRARYCVFTVVLDRATNPDVFAADKSRLLDSPVERDRPLRAAHAQLAVFAYLDLRLSAVQQTTRGVKRRRFAYLFAEFPCKSNFKQALWPVARPPQYAPRPVYFSGFLFGGVMDKLGVQDFRSA